MSKKNLRNQTMKNYHSTGMYTLGFIIKDQKVLMLRRIKDPNSKKLNGLGGKIEHDESISEGMIREVKEEAGITPLNYKLSCLLKCFDTDSEKSYMIFCYLISSFRGQANQSNSEGELSWIDLKSIHVNNLDLVDNIPYFLPKILQDDSLLEMNFTYYPSKNLCDYRGFQDSKSWQGTFCLGNYF